jgi:hypothetical protein
MIETTAEEGNFVDAVSTETNIDMVRCENIDDFYEPIPD